MAAFLHCLLRACFGESPDEYEENNESERPEGTAPRSRIMRSGVYQSTPRDDAHEDPDEDGDDDCCPGGLTERRSGITDASSPGGLQELFSRLRDRLFKSDSEIGEEASLQTSYGYKKPNGNEPFLRTASTFDESSDVPTISAEEIVLPGSKLQAQMALAAAKSMEEYWGDECVICMEGFDPTNPRMPTLCGCGENKTFFHLPCLYQWIEQNKKCPSCRKRLRWEEF
jgi:hypothetical protein